MPSKVRQANKLSAAHLAASLLSDHFVTGFPYHFKVAASSDLSDDERDAIWNIFADNMSDFYLNSSFGWDPPAKKGEIFDPRSRFILVRDTTYKDKEHKPLVAFITFRFERENKEDVVYCYEIQVASSARRNGLGQILLRQVVNIGAQQGMCKIMLTAFKANAAAIQFYEASGFVLDPTSPGYCMDADPELSCEGKDEADYRILSKLIVVPT